MTVVTFPESMVASSVWNIDGKKRQCIIIDPPCFLNLENSYPSFSSKRELCASMSMPEDNESKGNNVVSTAAAAFTGTTTTTTTTSHKQSTSTTSITTCNTSSNLYDPGLAVLLLYIYRWCQYQPQESSSLLRVTTGTTNNNDLDHHNDDNHNCIIPDLTAHWDDDDDDVQSPPLLTIASTPISVDSSEADQQQDLLTNIFSTCLAHNNNNKQEQPSDLWITLSDDDFDDNNLTTTVDIPDLLPHLSPLQSSVESQPYNNNNNSNFSGMMGHDDPRLRLLEFQSDFDAELETSSIPTSTTTTTNSQQHQQQQLVIIQQILDTVGQFIHTADRELQQLDESSVSNGLLRACQQLADSVGHLAEQIEQHPEKRQLAQACLQDFQQNNNNNHDSLKLYTNDPTTTTSSTKEDDESDWIQNDENQTTSSSSSMEENEMIQAMGMAAELLRDVEAAIRAISQDEADEIAQVGLIVAHLFVASLQQMHSQIHPHHQQQQRSTTIQESPNIELVSEEEVEEKNISDSSLPSAEKWKQADRVRCLWPPIGPEVAKALRWSKEELDKQHWLLTVALGITLWPVAVMGAIVGTPAIITDHCVQKLYQHFQNGPILTAAEMAAAQLYQTSRLCWITGKAMARPTFRVAMRQLQRHGPDMQDWMIHRITHPVQTIGETASGIAWLTGHVVHSVQEFMAQREEERISRVSEMQI